MRIVHSLLLASALAFGAPVQAQTNGFEPCDEHWAANMTTLFVGENGEGIRSFYNGSVLLLRINTEEPAFFPEGVILLMPDGDGSEGPIGRLCFVNWGFGSVDVDETQSSYDPARGLALTIPAGSTDPSTYESMDRTIRVLVNVGAGSVTPLN